LVSAKKELDSLKNKQEKQEVIQNGSSVINKPIQEGGFMSFLSSINGNKTNIIAIAAIVYAVSGVIAGMHDMQEAGTIILGALGIIGLRDSQRKIEEKVNRLSE
jgi:hypothetical protein